MTWAGLRGAVALTLALTIDRSYDVQIDPNGNFHGVTPKNQARVVFFTGGVVFLTLVVNGSTTKKVLALLRMDRLTESKLRILEYAKREMHDRALQSYVEVGEDDEELGPAHWPSVQKLVTYLRKDEFSGIADAPGSVLTDQTDEMRKMRLRDARVRFLRGVQAAYWDLLDQDRLSQYEAILLIQSVDRGLDDETELGDWDELKPYVKLPTWLKLIQRGLNQCSPNTLVNSLVVGSLERGCSMAAGYLRAHQQARTQLRDFLGNNELADEVIRESLKDEAQARAFLDDVGMSFPQALTSVKTRQVAFHVLRELTTYVEELDEAGLIDVREIVHLHDVVQKDLKKLRRAPLLIQPQRAMGILRSTPLGKHVPEHFEQIVRRDGKERTYLKNAVLYKEGSVGQEVYIVGTGLAKVITVDTADGERTVSHFILGSGSILGLYEALAGNRAKLTSAVADTVSLCYVLDRSRLVDIVKSDVRLAEYLWKESAVILSRLVLKRAVEHLTLQKIRLIIMEKSRLQHFDEGDDVNIRYGEVLILLEGSLKNTKGFTLVAPVGLAPDMPALLAGPLDTVRLKSELRYTAQSSSRVLFIPLGTHLNEAPATTPEQRPKTLDRRALSENEATITASKEMAAKLKEALLLETPEAARRSMVDLRKPPTPNMTRKPSGKRVGDVNRSPAGPSSRASLEEGGLVRSLPRPPSRAHLRPLAGLGVQMSLSREPSFTQGVSRGNSSGHQSGFLEGAGATPEDIYVAPVEEGDDLEAIIVDSGEDLFSEKRH